MAQEAATSFRSPGQAALVLRTVKGLLTAADLEGGPNDIAVVTPYSGQVSTTVLSASDSIPGPEEVMPMLFGLSQAGHAR